MSSREKKKRTKEHSLKSSPVLSPTPESTPISSLPDDLLVSCFARISKLYYPTLSLVSKKFRSLLTSPELHESRSILNRSESCLFVYFNSSRDSNQSWFTLCRKPNQTLTKKKKSSGYVLARIPIPNSPQCLWRKPMVTVGSNIYSIGGPIGEVPPLPSSKVSILDCRSYTWREAPRMRVERLFTRVNVLDGKIYVSGGGNRSHSSNWMEVFDPKTQTWEFVSSPLETCHSHIDKSVVIEGELVMFGNKTMGYKPKEDRWEEMGLRNLNLGLGYNSNCVIDNVVSSYSKSPPRIKWYDSKTRHWMDLKGLEGLPRIAGYSLVRLVDYGGKMVVLWNRDLRASGYKEIMILCGVIALERRNNNQEIWGKVEWLDGVLTVPRSWGYFCAFSAIV